MSSSSIISTWMQRLLLLLLLFFTAKMVQLSWPYLAIGEQVAFLRIKSYALQFPWWEVAFYVHVFTSTFLLLAGFTQFSSKILKRQPTLHRWMGRSYVILILVLSGPAGFVMGLLANGGIWSRTAFVLLALLWWWTTWQAWRTIRRGDIEKHRAFMYRSFALTLSAITLRAWKYLIVLFFAPPPMDVYRMVAWLGWIPNLLLAEWLIRRKKGLGQRTKLSGLAIKE